LGFRERLRGNRSGLRRVECSAPGNVKKSEEMFVLAVDGCLAQVY
jgi:hypothetical protein